MLHYTQLKRYDNNVASLDMYLHANKQINKIAQPFPEIFVIWYFGEHWAYPGMADQTQQPLHDLTKASTDI